MLQEDPHVRFLGYLDLIENHLDFFGIVRPYSFSTKTNSCFILNNLNFFRLCVFPELSFCQKVPSRVHS